MLGKKDLRRVEIENCQGSNVKNGVRFLIHLCAHMRAHSLQLCLTLLDPIDCSWLGSSVHGFSRQEYWSGLPFPPPGDLPNPGIEPGSPALQADSLPSDLPGKPIMWKVSIKLIYFLSHYLKQLFIHLFWLCWVFFVALRLSCPSACGILASQPGTEPVSLHWEADLNPWTTRKVPMYQI